MKFGNKSIFLIILSILFIISCDDYCEMTDYESYLPLEIGNKWKYRTGGNWEVTRTVNIYGSKYFEIEVSGENYQGNEYFYSTYYRFEKSKLYQFYQNDSIEVIIADFSLKEGEMFSQENTGYNVTVLSDDPNGFEFYYDDPGGADEEMAIKFQSDVGILGYCATAWQECFYNDLIEYEIK